MIGNEIIRLRAIERTDIPCFVHWINDPQVREHLALYLPISLALEEHWFEEMLKRPREEQPFAIELREGEKWKLIGNCGFLNIDWCARSGEIGILIGEKSVWNQGYGTQAMKLLLRHGFATLNLNQVYLRVYDPNKRGIRSYEKAGFIHEGRLRQAAYKNGQYQDVLFMSVLRSEWDALHE